MTMKAAVETFRRHALVRGTGTHTPEELVALIVARYLQEPPPKEIPGQESLLTVEPDPSFSRHRF